MNGQINKSWLLVSVLFSSFALTACGGSNGSGNVKTLNGNGGQSNPQAAPQDNANNNANSVTIEMFDAEYDETVKSQGIKRITTIHSDGNIEIMHRNIVNSNNRKGFFNKKDQIILANGFEGKLRTQDIDVEGNKIIFNILSNTTNQKEQSVVELQSVNLAGVKGSDGNIKKDTGMLTALTEFNKIPNSVSFPEGSVCYIPQISNTFNYIRFNEDNISSASSLSDWTQKHSNKSGRQLIRTESFKVGANNQYDASLVVYNTNLAENYGNYTGVAYKGKIYYADYYVKEKFSENTDVNKGAVYCTLMNTVAANFVQDQIIQYYK